MSSLDGRIVFPYRIILAMLLIIDLCLQLLFTTSLWHHLNVRSNTGPDVIQDDWQLSRYLDCQIKEAPVVCRQWCHSSGTWVRSCDPLIWSKDWLWQGGPEDLGASGNGCVRVSDPGAQHMERVQASDLRALRIGRVQVSDCEALFLSLQSLFSYRVCEP